MKYNDLINFIKADMTEEDFLTKKDNLILLKDYLLDLKSVKEDYINKIQEPLKSIQQKNNWVQDVYPFFSIGQRAQYIIISGKNDPVISCDFDNESNRYIFSGGYVHVPIVGNYRFNKRKKVLDNSQKEINEISQIIDATFDRSKYGTEIYSASGLFNLECNYDYCFVGHKNKFICSYDIQKLRFGTSYMEKNELTDTLTSFDYESLMDKIYLKKK